MKEEEPSAKAAASAAVPGEVKQEAPPTGGAPAVPQEDDGMGVDFGEDEAQRAQEDTEMEEANVPPPRRRDRDPSRRPARQRNEEASQVRTNFRRGLRDAMGLDDTGDEEVNTDRAAHESRRRRASSKAHGSRRRRASTDAQGSRAPASRAQGSQADEDLWVVARGSVFCTSVRCG